LSRAGNIASAPAPGYTELFRQRKGKEKDPGFFAALRMTQGSGRARIAGRRYQAGFWFSLVNCRFDEI
jgi:hypothetical protein